MFLEIPLLQIIPYRIWTCSSLLQVAIYLAKPFKINHGISTLQKNNQRHCTYDENSFWRFWTKSQGKVLQQVATLVIVQKILVERSANLQS